MLAVWGFLFLLVAVDARIDVRDFGRCQDIKVFADFDLQKFAGTWYRVEGVPSLRDAFMTPQCTSWVIDFKENGNANFMEKYLQVRSKVSKYNEITTLNKDVPAKLTVETEKGSIFRSKYNLWVLDTDYTGYAVVTSCIRGLVTHDQVISILSRERTLDDSTKMKIYEKLRTLGLKTSRLEVVDQKDAKCETLI